MPILDHHGNPISDFAKPKLKKVSPPITGEAFGGPGQVSGPNMQMLRMPGGGLVQFNLDNLTLADYRSMTTHYQVNSSLSVLSFMQHQSNWSIECTDPKIAAYCTDQMSEIWTQLNRSMSQANWAGFSPNILQWENNPISGRTELTKIKDLLPEMSVVNWKEVLGWSPPGKSPPKLRVFDGIKSMWGNGQPIPVNNSFWYPILMENGNYYGRKLLKPAYTSYFFSMLLHLFSNRYYERFGEPVPIGRAPFEETINVNGTEVDAQKYMQDQLMSLRNRSVVILPADRGEDTAGRGYFEYDLQYLESQMRGADFERYMQRLDQEISLSMFTPVLLMNTADVGSYNLGMGHMQMYLWMLNAMNADRKQYIDKYILAPMVAYNEAVGAPVAKIKFQKLDNTNAQLVQNVLVALLQGGTVGVDLDELGAMAGLDLKEVQQTIVKPGAPPTEDTPPKPVTKPKLSVVKNSRHTREVNELRNDIVTRVAEQVRNAFSAGRFNEDFTVNMGFKRRLQRSLKADGIADADRAVEGMYSRLDMWSEEVASLGSEFVSADLFIEGFAKALDAELERLV